MRRQTKPVPTRSAATAYSDWDRLRACLVTVDRNCMCACGLQLELRMQPVQSLTHAERVSRADGIFMVREGVVLLRLSGWVLLEGWQFWMLLSGTQQQSFLSA